MAFGTGTLSLNRICELTLSLSQTQTVRIVIKWGQKVCTQTMGVFLTRVKICSVQVPASGAHWAPRQLREVWGRAKHPTQPFPSPLFPIPNHASSYFYKAFPRFFAFAGIWSRSSLLSERKFFLSWNKPWIKLQEKDFCGLFIFDAFACGPQFNKKINTEIGHQRWYFSRKGPGIFILGQRFRSSPAGKNGFSMKKLVRFRAFSHMPNFSLFSCTLCF